MIRMLLLLCLPVGLSAQFALTPDFERVLDSFDLRVNHPLDAPFKLLPDAQNPYLAEQQRIYSRKEKLELRFALEREQEDSPYYGLPHVRVGHLIANLSSNEEGTLTTVLIPDDEEMAVLNADWARIFIFQPKHNVSELSKGLLVASYKAGRGYAFTLLFYNRPPASIQGRQLALRWR